MLVTYHCWYVNAYMARAQSLGTHHQDCMREWRRLVLYALTDALAHNHLLVGTIAAYLQRQDLDADLLRRYLQSPDPTATSPARPSSASKARQAPHPMNESAAGLPASLAAAAVCHTGAR
ncbi:hypothetical protein [Streptomyces sp. NPDC058579]|uniref:hypothetical protein n=1 Tax=Streptomyces sp. NPDC058579 TaxID=3346548 RepID=UPI003646D395